MQRQAWVEGSLHAAQARHLGFDYEKALLCRLAGKVMPRAAGWLEEPLLADGSNDGESTPAHVLVC